MTEVRHNEVSVKRELTVPCTMNTTVKYLHTLSTVAVHSLKVFLTYSSRAWTEEKGINTMWTHKDEGFILLKSF